MAAQNKSDLIAIAQKEFLKLHSLCDGFDPSLAMQKDEDATSVKDVIAHRAHWISLFLGWYSDGQAGKIVHFPAKGYKWNNLKRYNAELRDTHADLNWQQAQERLIAAHDRLMTFINDRPEAALYGGPMKGANNAWTTGRWAEAAGPSHYRSAAKYLRARKRAFAANQ
ncbi:MAG: ClbS/DfsB family four-helix bundle protein [Halocynthiibacter sp.]